MCERLVLARKSRRVTQVSVDCSTNLADTGCADRWPGNTFPVANGPALAFQVGVQTRRSAPADPVRNQVIDLAPASGVFPNRARGASTAPFQASGIAAFDRTPWTDPIAGYRFLVSYPADFVLDTTPSQNPAAAIVVR